jgi:hypothetical protein
MSVIRMTIPITSKQFPGTQDQVEYTLSIGADMDEFEHMASVRVALHDLGATAVYINNQTRIIHFVLDRDGDFKHCCRVAANYLRHQLDFGGGVEFRHECPHCGHEEKFVL